ncbi:hypothetical protein QCA50_008335 [Cerrena zonata]|uniref:C2H2-type domain-containing protein n=1 Tax=Cerrena zonata TaxID=2478898 RepID=A0AAW0GIK0_9APHY
MPKSPYSSPRSPRQPTFTSNFAPNDDVAFAKSRFQLRKVSRVSSSHHPTPRRQFSSFPSSTTINFPLIPFRSSDGCGYNSIKLIGHHPDDDYELLRLRIAQEAPIGKREVEHDVNFSPFSNLKDLQKFFYNVAARRLQQQQEKQAAQAVSEHKKLSDMPKIRIRCPMKTYALNSDEIIDCQTTTSRPQDLPRHIEIHTAIPRFACPNENCNYRSRQRSNMAQHQRVHTGETWAVCELCEMKFVQKADLSHHRSKDHGIKSGRRKRGDSWQYVHRKTPYDRVVKEFEKPKGPRLVKATWDEDEEDSTDDDCIVDKPPPTPRRSGRRTY